MEIVRCGKNLFDASAVIRRDGYRLDDNGTEVSTDVSGYTESLTRVSPNAVYTFRGNISSASYAGRLYFYDRNKNFISRSESIYYDVSHYTFNTPGNCFYIALQYVVSVVDFSTIQIEKGQLTVYEPYTASTFSISWTQQGTVYGGYVDLVSGELVEEYRLLDLGTLVWNYSGGNGTIWNTPSIVTPALKPAPSNYVPMPCYCEKYRTMAYGGFSHNNTNNYAIAIDTLGKPRIRDNDYDNSTKTEFNTSLNGVMIAAELAEPIRYQLTSIQIKTLKGINNIYSDADSAEVKFWTH